jgi:hypothetical protein
MEYGVCSTTGNVKLVAVESIETILTVLSSLGEEGHKINEGAQGKDDNHFTLTDESSVHTHPLRSLCEYSVFECVPETDY